VGNESARKVSFDLEEHFSSKYKRQNELHKNSSKFTGSKKINVSLSRRYSDTNNNITRICITGGPCAGKTTAIAAITQDLTQQGYKVL
jgi:putative protein kinase ArgK-like GTPase of G3E family